MHRKTIDARINAINNCMAVFDEVKQGLIFAGDSTLADSRAHGWLYKKLCILEQKYQKMLRQHGERKI